MLTLNKKIINKYLNEREQKDFLIKCDYLEIDFKKLNCYILKNYKNAFDFLKNIFAWWDLEDLSKSDIKELKKYKNIIDYLNDKKASLCDLMDFIYCNNNIIIF